MRLLSQGTARPPAAGRRAKKNRPAWWQFALVAAALSAAVYREMPYRPYVKTEGTTTQVTVRTSRNQTIEGCVVAYRYRVEYTDNQGQTHSAWHEHATESRTCRTDEIKPGNKTHVYYHPQNPAESVQLTSDTLGAALYLFGGGGAALLVTRWLFGRGRQRP